MKIENEVKKLTLFLSFSKIKSALTKEGAKNFMETLSPKTQKFFEKTYKKYFPSVCGVDANDIEKDYKILSENENILKFTELERETHWCSISYKEELDLNSKLLKCKDVCEKEIRPYLEKILNDKNFKGKDFLESLNSENFPYTLKDKNNKFLLLIIREGRNLQFELYEINKNGEVDNRGFNKDTIYDAFGPQDSLLSKNKLNFYLESNSSTEVQEGKISFGKDYFFKPSTNMANPLLNSQGMACFSGDYWMRITQACLSNLKPE